MMDERRTAFEAAVTMVVNDACTMVAKAFRAGVENSERERWISLINALEVAYPDIVKPLMERN